MKDFGVAHYRLFTYKRKSLSKSKEVGTSHQAFTVAVWASQSFQKYFWFFVHGSTYVALQPVEGSP